MADNKDRRHHHLNPNNNNYYPYPLRNSSTSNNNSSSSSLLLSSHSHSHSHSHRSSSSSPSPPPSSSSHSLAIDAASSSFSQDDDAPIAAAFSKKKLKVILKLPPHTSKPPTSSSPPLSSPSSDPYGSSPSHFSHHHHPTTTSVTSAPKKIPPASSTAPTLTSHRSALPLPSPASAKVPSASLSPLVTTSGPSATTVLAPATKAPSPFLPPYRANSAISASASALAVASDDEGAEKPSKKRRLRSVTEAQNAPLPASSSRQLTQGKQLHPSQAGVKLHTSSNLPAEKLNLKEKNNEDDAGAEIVSSSTPELPTQPMPPKQVLEGIIEKLQRKDTFGVFSEPVDPKEVPDYYDVIKNPMDFGTILKKISEGAYVSIDLFQKDIFLICSNAMRYNARHTVYYKQARSIQDTAQKILEALRSGTTIDEDQLGLKQRTGGLSTKKFLKKEPSGRLLFESTGSDYTSGAMPATSAHAEAGAWPNEVLKAEKWITSEKSGITGYWNLEAHSKRGPFGDYQPEDLAGSLRSASSKDSRRPLSDENRRNTYRPHNPKARENGTFFTPLCDEPLQLVPMGYHHEYAYAKSLARFAADLGPMVWRIAAQKIKKTLPPGLPFGPGWVGEQEAPGGSNLQSSTKEIYQIPQQMQMKLVDQQVHAGKSCIREQEAPGGANLQLCGKDRDHMPQKMQINVANHASAIHLDQQGHAVPEASRNHSFKCSAELEDSNMPRLDVSAFPPSTVCAQKELPNINCSMPTTEPAESIMDPSIACAQLSAMEPIKLSLAGGNFVTDVSQSKLLEMVSQNSRLGPWGSGNSNENNITSRSNLYPAEHSMQDKHFEASGNVNRSCSSTGIASITGFPKHAFIMQRERNLLSGNSQDISLEKSGLSALERQHTSQSLLKSSYISTPGPPSKGFSPVDPSPCNLTPVREDRRATWVHPQQSKGRESCETELLGNIMRNQLEACTPFSSQPQEGQSRQQVGTMQFQRPNQIRIGQGQHEYQARSASPQHENQRPSPVPLLQHHQFLNDAPPFVQQLARLHQQTSAKTVPLFHSGSLSNQDVNLVNLQSSFPVPMVAGAPPSLTQQWRFVPLQYPLQQSTGLSHSQPPDLNVSLQNPKSPLDQPSNSLTDSQQPDLALQL